jgi:hypothetical protein
MSSYEGDYGYKLTNITSLLLNNSVLNLSRFRDLKNIKEITFMDVSFMKHNVDLFKNYPNFKKIVFEYCLFHFNKKNDLDEMYSIIKIYEQTKNVRVIFNLCLFKDDFKILDHIENSYLISRPPLTPDSIKNQYFSDEKII